MADSSQLDRKLTVWILCTKYSSQPNIGCRLCYSDISDVDFVLFEWVVGACRPHNYHLLHALFAGKQHWAQFSSWTGTLKLPQQALSWLSPQPTFQTLRFLIVGRRLSLMIQHGCNDEGFHSDGTSSVVAFQGGRPDELLTRQEVKLLTAAPHILAALRSLLFSALLKLHSFISFCQWNKEAAFIHAFIQTF